MMDADLYQNFMDVLADDKFPEVDCMLRQGRHIGAEDIKSHSFLTAAFPLLTTYYKRYSCQLIHANRDVGDYFFLSSYGPLFGQRKLQPAEMIVGMTLAYLMTSPEFINRKVDFETLISNLKLLLSEENYFARLALRRRLRNVDSSEEKVRKNVATILRRLEALGFVSFGRGNDVVTVLASIQRFLDPIRGMGSLEENIRTLVNRGLLEDAGEDQEEDGDDGEE